MSLSAVGSASRSSRRCRDMLSDVCLVAAETNSERLIHSCKSLPNSHLKKRVPLKAETSKVEAIRSSLVSDQFSPT